MIVSIFLSVNVFSQITETTLILNADVRGQDATVGNAGAQEMNFGDFSYLYAFHDQEIVPIVFKSFLQFDLTHIPTNAIIVEAELILSPKEVIEEQSFDYNVRRVDGAWLNNEITGRNQNDDFISDAIKVISPNSTSRLSHIINVKDHVQNMVNYPYNNHGWKISLDNENLSGDYGVSFYSSNYTDVSKRPKLSISYVLPIEIDVEVSHCSAGNNDGSVDFTVNGGSGNYNLFLFHKLETDTAYDAKQSFVTIDGGSVVDNLILDKQDLAPGLYSLRIRDVLWKNSSSHRNHNTFKHFVIGREGEITEVKLIRYVSIDAVKISKNPGSNVLNYENTNYGQGNSAYLGVSATGTDSDNETWAYRHASLMNLNLEISNDLEIKKANLRLNPWSKYYQTHTSSNKTNFTVATTDWDQTVVTWNSRPETDENYRIVLEKTSKPHGYSPEKDVVNIIPFIEYWQTNPNYGFEMELASYDYPTVSTRDQRNLYTNSSYFEMSYTVKSRLTPTFDEASNKGTIVVDAPEGELPYTYLISETLLPTLSSIWDSIDSDGGIDSLSFFRGKVNSSSFTFSNLESGKYFVGVYDNNGEKIFDNAVTLAPELKLLVNNGLLILGDTIKVDSLNNINTASGVLFSRLPVTEKTGIEIEVLELSDGFILGLSAVEREYTFYVNDFEFSIEISSEGVLSFKNGAEEIFSNTGIRVNDRIKLIIEDNVLSYELNDIVQKEISLAEYDQDENFNVELQLKGEGGNFKVTPWFYKGIQVDNMEVNNPVCGDDFGSISIGASSYYGYTLFSCLLEDENGNSISTSSYTAGVEWGYTNLTPGTYTLYTGWSNSSFSYSSSEIITIGFPIQWVNLSNVSQIPNTINTIEKTDVNIPNYATANSINAIKSNVDYWIQTNFLISPGTPNGSKFKLSSWNTDFLIINLHVLTSGAKMFWFISNGNVMPLSNLPSSYQVSGNTVVLSDDIPLRVSHNGAQNTFDVTHKGNILVSFISPTPISNDDLVRAYSWLGNNTKIEKTISSFCYPIASNEVRLKRILDGGYYQLGEGVLKVEYDEEYNDEHLEFNIYDNTYSPTESSNLNEISMAMPVISYGDNRLQFDFSCPGTNCLPHGIYILEVINDKKEKLYLRFKN